jgi:hypothetical protein
VLVELDVGELRDPVDGEEHDEFFRPHGRVRRCREERLPQCILLLTGQG